MARLHQGAAALLLLLLLLPAVITAVIVAPPPLTHRARELAITSAHESRYHTRWNRPILHVSAGMVEADAAKDFPLCTYIGSSRRMSPRQRRARRQCRPLSDGEDRGERFSGCSIISTIVQ